MKKPYKITVKEDYYLQAIVWAYNEQEVEEIATQHMPEEFHGMVAGNRISGIISEEGCEIEIADIEDSASLPHLNMPTENELVKKQIQELLEAQDTIRRVWVNTKDSHAAKALGHLDWLMSTVINQVGEVLKDNE
jgi:hypothetical protein